jgi:hypothetical protein
MDRDSFFDNLRSDTGGSAEALRAMRQLAYEERVIKRVFAECGIKMNGWGRFANECREMTGHDKLNFEWFNRAFPRFPGTLCGRRIPGLHELTLHDIFKPRKSNRLAKAIFKGLHRYGLDPQDGSFVFVFPVVRTSFCAHALSRLNAPERVSWHMSWADAGAAGMTVEPTSGLGRAIGSEWFEV